MSAHLIHHMTHKVVLVLVLQLNRRLAGLGASGLRLREIEIVLYKFLRE